GFHERAGEEAAAVGDGVDDVLVDGKVHGLADEHVVERFTARVHGRHVHEARGADVGGQVGVGFDRGDVGGGGLVDHVELTCGQALQLDRRVGDEGDVHAVDGSRTAEVVGEGGEL